MKLNIFKRWDYLTSWSIATKENNEGSEIPCDIRSQVSRTRQRYGEVEAAAILRMPVLPKVGVVALGLPPPSAAD
jgi:hypothetical protein